MSKPSRSLSVRKRDLNSSERANPLTDDNKDTILRIIGEWPRYARKFLGLPH